MKRSQSDLLRLLGDLYGAGLGQRRWNESLKSLADFFGAAASIAIDVDRATGRTALRCGYGYDAAVEAEYDARMYALDPRAHQPLEFPGPHTSYDYDKLSEAEMQRNEFYDWLERTGGVRYYVGSRTIDGSKLISFATVDFHRRHGHASPEEIQLFKMLTPHIANAWRVSHAFAQLAAATGAFGVLQETVDWGVIGLDREGSVLTMNGRARAVMQRGDGLKVERGSLRALRSAEDRTLKLIVAHTLRGLHGDGIYPGGALSVPRLNGRMPYALRVMPTAYGGEIVPDAVPIVLVFIGDPDARHAPGRRELQRFFALSEREAELTQHLAAGLSLDEAAQQMSISRNTARNQLSSVFGKTGVRSQSELISLLSSLPAEAAAVPNV
jgi:DNA-binding CsgD family transcriptional regulator